MTYSAFLFGLISSFHCIGMCGPIALMLPVGRDNSIKKTFKILTYHIGRLTAYTTLGFLFGLLGRGFFMAGIQQKISIFIGIAMIIVAVLPPKIFAKYNFSKPVFSSISSLKTALGNQFKK